MWWGLRSFEILSLYQHLFNIHLLNTYYVSDTLISTVDTEYQWSLALGANSVAENIENMNM